MGFVEPCKDSWYIMVWIIADWVSHDRCVQRMVYSVLSGLKALKKFKRLMLHRIQWNPRKRGEGEVHEWHLVTIYYTNMHVSIVESDDSDNEASSSKKKKNSCTLVWEVSDYNYCILLYTLVYYCLVLLYTTVYYWLYGASSGSSVLWN